MPPKKLSQKSSQQMPQTQTQNQSGSTHKTKNTSKNANTKSAVPEHEVKKSSSVSAQLALEAAKKAYDLRQAAYGAADPNAREEILAQAINKEIEAESFGKAAKYTRSGAFQGLAAGAGLGIQPGVTLGKLTGALVGGLVSSVGALLGGGVGSAYGAISGPFWDLGQIASQGVRSIVGDFPNWEATPSQKAALEKMVMGAQRTKAPNTEELEQMRSDDGGASELDYQEFAKSLTSWIPNAPSLPSMPSMPSISSIPGLGSFGTQPKMKSSTPTTVNPTKTATKPSQRQQKLPSTQTQTAQKGRSAASTNHGAAPRKTSLPATSQQSQKADEAAVKKRPKKLEVRSMGDAPQPGQQPVKRAPPKLGPRQNPSSTKT